MDCGLFGMPKNIWCSEGGPNQALTGKKKHTETIPLKINRPLRCNTEVDLEGTGHEGMDSIRPANYIDQFLALFN